VATITDAVTFYPQTC